ncbi:hypothetical protein [Pseudogemmobacter sp. W21_MBD1_M6]|uniref:hypothetical protein n=1 Tax=Pseudogemmobacter sp. W21_MBD1_M6 TaxID=3240271 RepID=UPI003F9A6EEA
MRRFYILLATVLFAAALTIGVAYRVSATMPTWGGFVVVPAIIIIALALRRWAHP